MNKKFNYEYLCRVCGLEQSEPPWGEDGRSPTYGFCPCCGVEFGYGDASLVAIRTHREKWLSTGAKWDSPGLRPDDWELNEQLKCIPTEYR